MAAPKSTKPPERYFNLPPEEVKKAFQAGFAIAEAQDAAAATKMAPKRSMTLPESFSLPRGERLKEMFRAGLAIAEAQEAAKAAKAAPSSDGDESNGDMSNLQIGR